MQIRVDLDRCVGHGRCYDLASELFEDDERGHCVLIQSRVPAGLEKKAEIAAANCPEGAIEVAKE